MVIDKNGVHVKDEKEMTNFLTPGVLTVRPDATSEEIRALGKEAYERGVKSGNFLRAWTEVLEEIGFSFETAEIKEKV